MDISNKFAIHEAARRGQASVVESMLNIDPRLASKRDDDERLPIHWAISGSHRDVVDLLMASVYFDPDAQDGSGWTALMIASSLADGNELVNMFLQKGSQVNMKNYNGQTALHFCVSKNNIDLARQLIAHKASARVKDKRGQLPLHRAAAIGSVPLTALHHAIAEGHGDTALFLLKAGAEMDKRDVDDNLAIDLAPDTKTRKYILQSAEREGIDLI